MTKLNTERATSLALCMFRNNRAAEFNNQLAIAHAAEKGSDKYFVAMDKALQAAEDCHAAHEALGAVNPCNDVWDMEGVELIRIGIQANIDAAYERAEAAVEDAALRQFHHDAYGDAA